MSDTKSELEKAGRQLEPINVHVARRLMSGDVILYKEPRIRLKKDGTPVRQTVIPWADLNNEQVKALVYLLLTAIKSELSAKVYASESNLEAVKNG